MCQLPTTTTSLVDERRHVRTDTVVVQQTLNAARSGDGNVLVPDVLLRHTLNLGRRHRVDGHLNLLRRRALACRNELATNVLGNSSRAVQTQQERRLQLATWHARPRQAMDPSTRAATP